MISVKVLDQQHDSLSVDMTMEWNNIADQANKCPACGLIVNGGKAACLRLFEEVIEREFADYRYGRVHRLTVDAYSMQHPDDYMRSPKSFVAHLTGLYAAVESQNPEFTNQVVQKWLSTNPRIQKPAAIPEMRGDLTIYFVHSADKPDQHVEYVRQWAVEVWKAWSGHHYLAKQWADIAELAVAGRS